MGSSAWAWRAAFKVRSEQMRDQLIRHVAEQGVRELEAYLKAVAS